MRPVRVEGTQYTNTYFTSIELVNEYIQYRVFGSTVHSIYKSAEECGGLEDSDREIDSSVYVRETSEGVAGRDRYRDIARAIAESR